MCGFCLLACAVLCVFLLVLSYWWASPLCVLYWGPRPREDVHCSVLLDLAWVASIPRVCSAARGGRGGRQEGTGAVGCVGSDRGSGRQRRSRGGGRGGSTGEGDARGRGHRARGKPEKGMRCSGGQGTRRQKGGNRFVRCRAAARTSRAGGGRARTRGSGPAGGERRGGERAENRRGGRRRSRGDGAATPEVTCGHAPKVGRQTGLSEHKLFDTGVRFVTIRIVNENDSSPPRKWLWSQAQIRTSAPRRSVLRLYIEPTTVDVVGP